MLTTEWDFEKEIEIIREEEREKSLKEGRIEERIIICRELGLSYTDTFKK